MSGQQDGFALGVDLGTSNTVAVLRWPDGRTRPLLVDGQPILPSGVYADADGQLHVGRDAQRLAQVDPDRYEANPKRRVDEADVMLGDRRLSPAELLAAVLFTVAEAAVGTVGFLPPAVVTCPATWDADRRQVLADALALAGWPPAAEHTMSGPTPPGTRLLREPVAAARHYTEVLRRPVPVGDAVAVFDFGGGTLDVAVVRNEGADPWGDSGFTVVSCGGLDDLGGLDLDAALVELLGARVAAANPDEWARLTRPENTTQWRDRLRFLENVRGAKEMLSRATVAPVAVPGVEAAVALTREDLEGVATPLLRRAVTETRRVVSAAGLTPERLAGLFLVGGSSRIPLVARLLHAELGVAPTVLEQPELPVAEGALTDLPLRPGRSTTKPLIPAPAGPPPGPAGASPEPGPAGTLPDGDRTPRLPAGAGEPADTVPNDAGRPRPAMAHGLGPAGTLLDEAAGTTPAMAGRAAPSHAAGAAGLTGQGGGAAGSPMPGQAGGALAAPPAPWAGVPQPVSGGGPGVPPSNAAGSGGRRRALWISIGAVAALAGVATAAVLYLTRDRHPELDFQAFDRGKRILAGADRPSDMFTATLGDRAYLAYPRDDDRLEVIAVDAGTGEELWRRQSAAPAEQWDRIVALPDAVALVADAAGTSTPRELEVLDAGSGRQRWHHPVHGDDEFFFGTDVMVLADRDGHRLVGLRVSDGTEKWSRADPRDQYGSSRTSVHLVTSEEGLAGPGFAGGGARDPWQGEVRRIVQVASDRSVRLIDMATGAVLRRRTNVAEPDDLVVAHSDRLYVANDDGGFQLLAYDLGSSAEPTVLYRAPDDRHRPKGLVPCGEHRACLLEVTDADQATAAVVAAAEGKKAERWSAPGADLLVPLGERVLARRTYPDPAVTLFGPDGQRVLDARDGVAVRVDAGNLLVFAEPLGSGEDDRSVAGVGAESGRVVELGQLKDVRGESCSWNTEVIACGSAKDFVLHRFAAG
ncbi:Hsp70 family protein [Micromonospora inositola]|uniref:PQQ-like domain-containing protein n=1 Tax=Micromonospora inositola TaxID=47865 RepID=A0A1C5IN80_9ACTN|nr:Hsp70 family protein [Micromonospora inositola]SCG59742.1 PQQ-like domain-containing protein [Micromonospora inositola]